MNNGFVKAIDAKGMLFALLVLAIGGVAVSLGLFDILTLKIGSLRLPSWSMYILGGIFGVIALVMFMFAANSAKCSKCGKLSSSDDAYFPLENLDAVVHAVENNQPEALESLQKVPKNQMKSELDITYCTGCGELAEVQVNKWAEYVPSEVLPKRVVTGAVAQKYRDLARAHAEWRGDETDED